MRRPAEYMPLTFAVLAACSSPLVASDRVRVDVWGGTSVTLEVTDQGGRIELDCAHGVLEQVLESDSSGEFEVAGTLTSERPGPQREGDSPPARRARYVGRADSRAMTLRIIVSDTGERIGPLTLAFGASGRLRKCL